MADPEPHRLSIDVRFAELDAYGHLNHAVYATYFETARVEALRDHDLELNALSENGYHFVVTNLVIDFKRPAMAYDQVRVETWVSQVRRASSVWSQRLWRNQEMLASAEVRVAITNTSGKPTRPPPWLFDRLASLVILDQ